MKQKIEISEKNLDQAITSAALELGVDLDRVGYEVKKESSGFLGLGRKTIISAWAKSKPRGNRNKRVPAAPNPNARELDQKEISSLQEELRVFCAEICQHMFGEDVTVTGNVDGKRLILNVENDHFAKQLSKSTRIAESFEHLLRKKPKHIRQELPFRIFVDANSVRKEREDELSTMAADLSNKVFENKKPIVLNYKSSYDRKIIHMALDKDDRVYTKSIGSGPNRKLMILPTKDGETGKELDS